MGSNAAPTASPDRAAALDALHGEIAQRNMFPFWAATPGAEHDEVRRLMGESRRAEPFLWSYADQIEPLLERAAKLVTTVESERRSLILVNPGLAPRRATVTTMYTAYRLNSPNEVMPPHRHSPCAIRFGLTGKQNFTGIEGEDIVFGPGDLCLTPQYAWHNHGNVGDEPAVNLSVLDLPLVETLNAIHFDHDYKENGVDREQADGALPGRLLAAHLRQGRPAAALRVAPSRRGPRLADVLLSLGADARDARAAQATGTAIRTRR